MNNLLLFGGTFDPVHLGHLNIAVSIQKFFHFDQFSFLPCKLPVLDKGTPSASASHRVAMLKLALTTQPKRYHFCIDTREINRESPSYTVTTLEELRQQWGETKPITLLLGMDAFCQLPQWHQWNKLIQLANLLIINRMGCETLTLPPEINTLLLEHETTTPLALLQTPQGLIARFDAGNYDISSTAARKSLVKKESSVTLLPESVNHYIIKNKLYNKTP